MVARGLSVRSTISGKLFILPDDYQFNNPSNSSLVSLDQQNIPDETNT